MATDKDIPPKGDEVQKGHTYLGQLIIKKDKEGIKKYNSYAREHAARLRQLEREARGELAPGGDYD